VKARVWKRAKDAWVLIVDGEDRTGKRKQRWTTYRTKGEAEAALVAFLKADQHVVVGSKMTVEEWLDVWLRDYLIDLKKKTRENYRDHTKRWRALIGHIKLERLHAPAIQEAISALLRTDLKPSTISANCRCLHIALEQAVRSGLIATNPCKGIRVPKAARKQVIPLQATQVAQILEQMSGSHFYMPTLISAVTGARRGECLALRWRDVDMERGTISIVESKTDRGRRMSTLPPFAVKELRAEQKRQAANKLKYGTRYQHNDLVCCREDGSPVSEQSVSEKFHRVVKKLKVQATFHDLRHTHASMLLRAGVSPKVIQERLGHANISETLDTYSHLYEGMQAEIAGVVEGLLAADCKSQISQ